MNWIAVNDRQRPWSTPALAAARMSGRDGLLRNGSLYLETTAPSLTTGAVLLRLNRADALDGLVSIQWVPGMGLVAMVTQKDILWQATLPLDEIPDTLSVMLTWAAGQGARLSVEDPTGTLFATITIAECPPLRVSDAFLLTREPMLGAAVQGVALADAPCPLGPWPSLGHDTLVETAEGNRPLHSLKPGDTVRSLKGDLVPVLHVIRQDVPAIGRHRPLTLRAASPGRERSVALSVAQALIMTGSDVRAHFGRDAVRVRAGDLPSVSFSPRRDAAAVESMVQVVLPEAEPILSDGLVLDTMSFADLRQDWKRFSLGPLGQCPWHQLPQHPPSPFPLLRPNDVARLLDVAQSQSA